MTDSKTFAWISAGFVLAGLVNILGMLAVSKGLDNPQLVQADPAVFSTFGQAMILVWGLAYIAVAKQFAAVPWLCLVFFVEKLAYVAAWVIWWAQSAEQFGSLWDADPLTAIFIAGYGLNDLAFGLFFLLAFFVGRRTPPIANS